MQCENLGRSAHTRIRTLRAILDAANGWLKQVGLGFVREPQSSPPPSLHAWANRYKVIDLATMLSTIQLLLFFEAGFAETTIYHLK